MRVPLHLREYDAADAATDLWMMSYFYWPVLLLDLAINWIRSSECMALAMFLTHVFSRITVLLFLFLVSTVVKELEVNVQQGLIVIGRG